MSRTKSRAKISEAGAWVMHRLAMRESPAWRALPDLARRILDRLELEHMRHGGTQNGYLLCTYDHFEEFGMRRASLALAIRQTVALGFVEITQAGFRTAAEFRAPNLYRLTYVFGRMRNTDPTDEWEAVKTDAEALQALDRAAAARRYTRQPQPARTQPLTRNIEGKRVRAPRRPRSVGAVSRLAARVT